MDTQTFQAEEFDWGGRVDLDALINRVADQFALSSGMPVDAGARYAMVSPARPHSDQVSLAVQKGSITVRFLEDCIETMLRNAFEIASDGDRRVIDRQTIIASMNRYCPYLFWC